MVHDMHTRRRRPDYLQACPTGPPVDGVKSALTPALWPCTFCSDPLYIIEVEITAYCTLFSVWMDKYDVQTLFSIHSRRKLIQQEAIFRQRLNNIHQRAITVRILENTRNNM